MDTSEYGPSSRGRGGAGRAGRGGYYQPRGRGGGRDSYSGGREWDDRRGVGGYYDQQGYQQGGRGGYQQGFYQGGSRSRGRDYWGGRGGRDGRGGYQGRRGGGGRAYQQGQPAREPLPDDVEFLSDLKGHTKKVTSLQLEPTTGQLFTGSHDGTIRVWSCITGECSSTVQVGGEVDSMLLEGGYLFAGVKMRDGRGLVKAWDMATNQEHTLEGHTGQVLCLAAAGGMLFSGGQDQTIRVWQFDAASGTFAGTAALRHEQGGHSAPVSCLCVSGPFLFSADFRGHIKVWDLAAGAVRQNLDRAHRGSELPAITDLLVWEGHLISTSLDGLIKVWEPAADASTGQVVSATPAFTFPTDLDQQSSGDGGGRGGRGGRRDELPGILSMAGVTDAAGKAVLMASYNGERVIRLWELPSFVERGALCDVNNARAVAGFAPGRLLLSGDEHGRVKVWRWKDVVAALPGA